METISQNVIMLLFVCGVFGAETDEMKTVMEGDSVTINPDLTEINKYWEILWRFEQEIIAEIDGDGNISYKDGSGGRFKNRLQLDSKTASLTITNMRMKHSGLYKLEASSSSIGTKDKTFSVAVYESPDVSSVDKVELKRESVTEGHTVILQTDVTETHGDELIVWRFGDEGKLIAKHDIEAKSSTLHDTDERFRDRLKMDEKTGSLTITNSKTNDSELYTVKISSNKQTFYRRFTVTISAVPDPGLSSGAVAGIVIGVLLVSAAAAAGGLIYYHRKISELESQKLKKVFVMEGDDVTLNTDVTKIQSDDLIEWRFGDGGTLIVKLRKGIIEIYENGRNESFTDRLELDKKTGSLTIKDTRTTHSGLYQLKIRQDSKIKYKMFNVSVCVRNISVEHGKNLILSPETEIKKDDQIQWMFGEILIAELREGTVETHDDVADGRFRGRLELDEKTGSLTITDMRIKQSGEYKLQIIRSRGNTNKRFVVTVYLSLKSVDEGKPVTLETNTEIQKDDQIQWRFGDILIAEVRGGSGETHDDDVRFRGRLKLDETTGSLTIARMRNEHTGDYKLQISSSRGNTNKRFKVVVVCSAYTSETVLDGENVTLSSDTYIVKDEVQWLFNDEILATGKNGDIKKTSYCEAIFKDRLKLDNQTGSLTIKNIRPSDDGVYHLNVSTLGIERRFRVTVNVRNIFVSEGKNLILNPETEIQKDDQIQWRFGDKEILIAELRGGTGGKTHDDDERFRGRLELDEKTGSLIITDMRINQSGDYKLQIISSRGNTDKRFVLTVHLKTLFTCEGKSVILKTDTEIQSDDVIEWRFGDKGPVIAEIRRGIISKYDDVADGIFRGKLELDKKNGSLTITNSEKKHAGVYQLQITSGGDKLGDKTESLILEVQPPAPPLPKCLPPANRVTESATVEMPPVDEEDPDVGNEQEGMSLLVMR